MSEIEVRELAADIFRRAAAYIRQNGWQVEGMGSAGGPRCSMGALASAYPARHWDKRLAAVMYDALYKELPGSGLTAFNHRHRDGAKVVELCECVAAGLSSQIPLLAIR